MDFSYTELRIRSDSLIMDYFLVPWDTEIVGQPVAEISNIVVVDPDLARSQYSVFEDWCESHQIDICSCRINHDRLNESFFLQNQGFRFIELNYHPVFHSLRNFHYTDASIEICNATQADQQQLAGMAGRIFKHGRFHQDPSLGEVIGNARYKIWLVNSFSRAGQSIYKCLIGKEIVGFFVVEYPREKHCHWSLIGLAPGFEGRGMGTRVWKAMLNFHKNEGMKSISTSISSHNIAILNLYVKLGFRFPMPQSTFHWKRSECCFAIE